MKFLGLILLVVLLCLAAKCWAAPRPPQDACTWYSCQSPNEKGVVLLSDCRVLGSGTSEDLAKFVSENMDDNTVTYTCIPKPEKKGEKK